MSSTANYWLLVSIAAVLCVALCTAARRWPGRWTVWAGRLLALMLAADAVTFVTTPLVRHDWSVRSSLPLALCDVALVIAALACAWPERPLLVELTYFWGLAGTLQAVITPDLAATFPHLEFFEYAVGHLGIVIAALFLVIGLQRQPRPAAAQRVFVITLIYAAAIGGFDAVTGSDYMFLAAKPATWSLLSVLGPWPWYILSATGVAAALLLILDLPFRIVRSRPAGT